MIHPDNIHYLSLKYVIMTSSIVIHRATLVELSLTFAGNQNLVVQRCIIFLSSVFSNIYNGMIVLYVIPSEL